jgi:aerotaxis receptor
VANEVRTLAQRCAGAVKETEEKITASSVQEARSSELSKEVQNGFKEILNITHSYHSRIAEIEKASRQHVEGVKQIGEAISRLDVITQNTAAVAEQNASGSTEMVDHATAMMKRISVLEAMASKRNGQSAGEALAGDSFSDLEEGESPRATRETVATSA